MKNIYTSGIALLMMSAAAFAQDRVVKVHPYNIHRMSGRVEAFVKQNIKGGRGFAKIGSTRPSAGAGVLKAADADTVITAVPEGTLIKNAYGTADGYFIFWGSIYKSASDGSVIDVVENDKELYVKNPFSTIITNTWLKGLKTKALDAAHPDTVKVKLPQPIYAGLVEDSQTGETNMETLYAYNIKITYDEEGNEKSYAPSDNQEAVFTWDGDTLKKLGTEVLGLATSDGTWLGYGDRSLEVFRQTDEPVVVPASAKRGFYALTYKTDPDHTASKIVRGATDGKDVYLSGLAGEQDLWAKGSLADNKMVIKRQYIGVDTAQLYHKYFIPAEVAYTYDEEYGTWDNKATEKDDIAFDYDAAQGTLATQSAFVVNSGRAINETTPLYTAYGSPQYKPWEDKAYTPKEPVIEVGMAYQPDYGYAGLSFVMEPVDVEGNLLDVNKLYYIVYINDVDHPYTFSPDSYESLKTDMTEVPATFTDDFDFQISGSTYNIFFYDTDFDNLKVGVKAIYKGGGSVRESAVAWKEVSGVESVRTAAPEQGRTFYTDLTGRRVTRPAGGLFIRTSVNADGSVKSVKVVK